MPIYSTVDDALYIISLIDSQPSKFCLPSRHHPPLPDGLVVGLLFLYCSFSSPLVDETLGINIDKSVVCFEEVMVFLMKLYGTRYLIGRYIYSGCTTANEIPPYTEPKEIACQCKTMLKTLPEVSVIDHRQAF